MMTRGQNCNNDNLNSKFSVKLKQSCYLINLFDIFNQDDNDFESKPCRDAWNIYSFAFRFLVSILKNVLSVKSFFRKMRLNKKLFPTITC